MQTRLLEGQLWPQIEELGRSSKKQIAVAFLGTGASRMLGFRRDDELFVDMSLSTVRSGQTNPYEIEKLMKKGVDVYNCENLHAKVYLSNRKLIVGSANLSKSSHSRLVEVGLITTEPTALVQAHGFFRSLKTRAEPIGRGYLNLCKRKYSPPPFPHGSANRGLHEGEPRLWVQSVEEVKFGTEEQRVIDKGKRIAAARIRKRRDYTTTTIRYPSSSKHAKLIESGDRVIVVFTDKRGHVNVWPPYRVLWKMTRQIGRFERTYLFLEEARDAKTKPLKKFVAFARTLGLKRVGKDSNREIRDSDTKHALEAFW